MFDFFKKKRERRTEIDRGFHHAQQWKENAPLQRCFHALRGSFTVAQAYYQEAVEATVAIALTEDNWTGSTEIPADFLGEKCFILWNEPTLPVLLSCSAEVLNNLQAVTAVSKETYLISETMDQIVHVQDDAYSLYSIT